MKDASLAQLLSKDPWKKYPKDMLKYKARGRNLKDNFAAELNGIGQGEHDLDKIIDLGPKTIADDLNSIYGPQTKKVSESINTIHSEATAMLGLQGGTTE
jgi:hypothetical protein